MVSVGHRTGLFDAMDGRDWSTSEELAAAAELDERYVREWLGAMVTGRVVEYRPEDSDLPAPRRARALADPRGSTPENLAVTAQWISVLGGVESQDRRLLRGTAAACPLRVLPPLPRGRWPRRARRPSSPPSRTHILPCSSDGLEASGSKPGIDVLDVGCGSRPRGDAQLAERFPRAVHAATTSAEDAVEARATPRPGEPGTQNVTLRRPGHHRTWTKPNAYDLVTAFDIVHDQKDPPPCWRTSSRCLKPTTARSSCRTSPARATSRRTSTTRSAVRLHDLDDALHDRVPRPGRRRPRHHVGRGTGRTKMLHRQPGSLPSPSTSSTTTSSTSTS